VNTKLVEDIADAVMYEGYMLYPYRASAIKNQQRWNFGVIYPRPFVEAHEGNDSWSMQTECLAQSSDASPKLTFRLRFLHLLERSAEDKLAQTWQEGTERDVIVPSLSVAELSNHAEQHRFAFAARSEKDGIVLRKWEPIEGCVEAEADALGNGLFRIRLRAFNTASLDDLARTSRDRALLRSLVSAHTILEIEGGEFISLLEPPDDLREAAAQCKNVGTWPVLVGQDGSRDAMLSSPIILYDYPKIAPESAGNLFDGTEIDEILTLRVLTMTDNEKVEMAQGDERARRILERTESMPPEQLMKMHGVLRSLRDLCPETP
jgi:hypothetical protein